MALRFVVYVRPQKHFGAKFNNLRLLLRDLKILPFFLLKKQKEMMMVKKSKEKWSKSILSVGVNA
jgi:hypothetical protein